MADAGAAIGQHGGHIVDHLHIDQQTVHRHGARFGIQCRRPGIQIAGAIRVVIRQDLCTQLSEEGLGLVNARQGRRRRNHYRTGSDGGQGIWKHWRRSVPLAV